MTDPFKINQTFDQYSGAEGRAADTVDGAWVAIPSDTPGAHPEMTARSGLPHPGARWPVDAQQIGRDDYVGEALPVIWDAVNQEWRLAADRGNVKAESLGWPGRTMPVGWQEENVTPNTPGVVVAGAGYGRLDRDFVLPQHPLFVDGWRSAEVNPLTSRIVWGNPNPQDPTGPIVKGAGLHTFMQLVRSPTQVQAGTGGTRHVNSPETGWVLVANHIMQPHLRSGGQGRQDLHAQAGDGRFVENGVLSDGNPVGFGGATAGSGGQTGSITAGSDGVKSLFANPAGGPGSAGGGSAGMAALAIGRLSGNARPTASGRANAQSGRGGPIIANSLNCKKHHYGTIVGSDGLTYVESAGHISADAFFMAPVGAAPGDPAEWDAPLHFQYHDVPKRALATQPVHTILARDKALKHFWETQTRDDRFDWYTLIPAQPSQLPADGSAPADGSTPDHPPPVPPPGDGGGDGVIKPAGDGTVGTVGNLGLAQDPIGPGSMGFYQGGNPQGQRATELEGRGGLGGIDFITQHRAGYIPHPAGGIVARVDVVGAEPDGPSQTDTRPFVSGAVVFTSPDGKSVAVVYDGVTVAVAGVTAEGTPADGYTVAKSGDNLAFQGVDADGAADNARRITDAGSTLPRVWATVGAPTLDATDGVVGGDIAHDAATPKSWVCTDAATPTWIEIATAGGGSGDVVGPASATDGAMVEFDTTTGKLIKDGGVVVSAFLKTVLDDADAATARATLGAGTGNGTVTGVTATSPIVSSGGTAPNITHANSGATATSYRHPRDVAVNATGHVTSITTQPVPELWDVGRAYVPRDWVYITNDSGVTVYECILGHTSGSTNNPQVGADRDIYWVILHHQNHTLEVALTDTEEFVVDENYFGGTQFLLALTGEGESASVLLPTTPGTDCQYGDTQYITAGDIGGSSSVALKDETGATLVTFTATGQSVKVKLGANGWYVETAYAGEI